MIKEGGPYTLNIILFILIEDKLRENWLKWFGYIKRKPTDAPIRKSDLVSIDGNVRGKGIHKLTWWDIIKKTLYHVV